MATGRCVTGRMAMLDISRIFEDGIHVFRNFSSSLTVPPLPATIFMMQRDVVDHYGFALMRSLTPYADEECVPVSHAVQRDRRRTNRANEACARLALVVRDVIRYTARLGHATELAGFDPSPRPEDLKNSRIRYVGIITELRRSDAAIGLRMEPGHVLIRTPFATASPEDEAEAHRDADEAWLVPHKTIDAHGVAHPTGTSGERRSILRPERIDISDRTVLQALREEGLREVAELERLNTEFGYMCRAYYRSRTVATRYP